MRIAIFSDNFYPELSGIANSIAHVAQELGTMGHKIAIYAPRYTRENYQTLNPSFHTFQEIDLGSNITVYRFAALSYPTGTGQGRLVIPIGFRVLRVRSFNPDLIHVHLPMGVGIEGLIAATILKKPLIGTNHTPTAEFMRYIPLGGKKVTQWLIHWTTWFYNRCQFVSSPSQSIFREMRTYGFKAPHEVISNPLDTQLFQPLLQKSSCKLTLGLSNFTIFYAGRLAQEKHIDVVLQAVALLADQIPEINLVITGRGATQGELEILAKKLNIANRVKFLGFLDEKELPFVYEAADLFIMMSTAETQNIAMMQAMLMELPVIGARAWGLEDYINAENGFLVGPGDVYALAEKILYLYQNPDIRKKIGQAGRRFAQQFSIPIIAQQWEQIYREVLDRYKKKRAAQ